MAYCQREEAVLAPSSSKYKDTRLGDFLFYEIALLLNHSINAYIMKVTYASSRNVEFLIQLHVICLSHPMQQADGGQAFAHALPAISR